VVNRIKNFKQWILNEGEFYQDELNTLFWSNSQFDPSIREKLLQIANEFYQTFKLEIPISDIQLTGSLANYNWTPKSDLDVHVLIDFSKLNPDIALVKKGIDGQRFIWNLRHNIIIRRHDVELYLQDINEPHIASGLFSLLNNEWIRIPKYNPPQIDEMDVQKKFEGIVNDINQLEANLQNESQEISSRELYDHSEKVKSRIMKMRKEGLAERGEFSVENLVFKKLRNEGYIQNLIDLISRSYEKIYNE
jgi:predicted nucleotidyltransferase